MRLTIKCDQCHEVMTEDDLKVDYREGGDIGEPHWSCPYCGCDSWTYVRECVRCGEYSEDTYGTAGSELCDKCIDELADEETVIEYGQDEQTETKVNGFLAYVFYGDIDEILKSEFMKLPKQKRKEYLKGYVDCDKSDFSDWYWRNDSDD